MNYEITKEWKTLSAIIGNSYSNSVKYRIHNNVENPSKLCMTEVENPTDTTIGRKFPELCEIYIDSGCNPKLRVLTKLSQETGFNVEITEVNE